MALLQFSEFQSKTKTHEYEKRTLREARELIDAGRRYWKRSERI